jgi:hypothetical protein
MNILISDSRGLSTVVGCGALPRGSQAPILNASQIAGWAAGSGAVFLQLDVLTRGSNPAAVQRSERPGHSFGIPGGDCLYDTGSLFFFAGPRTPQSNNVLMVLWNFPAHPNSRNIVINRSGRLNVPPSAGVLAGGDIKWEIEG